MSFLKHSRFLMSEYLGMYISDSNLSLKHIWLKNRQG